MEGHARGEDTTGRDSFLDKLATYGKRCTLLDQSDTLVKVIRGQAAAIVCRSNDEAITKAKAQVSQSLPMSEGLCFGVKESPLVSSYFHHMYDRQSRQ